MVKFDRKTALLIVDMLNDFVRENGALPVAGAKGLLPAIRTAQEAARAAGAPVIYLGDAHRPDDPEFKSWPPHCVKGSEGAQVTSELAPETGDVVIPKRRFSGFFGTDLDLHLRERGIRKVVICGVLTDICVYHTAADSRQNDYQVAILEDGVAAATEEEHKFALKQMERLFGAERVRALESGAA